MPAKSRVRVRKPKLEFSNDFDRAWADGDIILSHCFQSVGILVPAFEKAAAHSLSDALPHILEPRLKAETQGYIGQEIQHANYHIKYLEILRDNQYDLRRMLAFLDTCGFAWLRRRLPAKLFLVVVAGFEHITLKTARNVFDQGVLLRSNNSMARLCRWHLAEEVEHRRVAFDVIQYFQIGTLSRCVGVMIATVFLLLQFYYCALAFMRQDHLLSKPSAWISLIRHSLTYFPTLWEMVIDFISPNYDPDQYTSEEFIADSICVLAEVVEDLREQAGSCDSSA